MSGSNVEETSEQTHEREIKPIARGKGMKDKSYDAITNMEARLAKVELAMADTREGVDLISKAWRRLRGSNGAGTKVEVPKPHTFSGKRDAKELDNFLWHMKRNFEAITLTDEATMVRTATLYLTDNATLWWCQRCGLPSKKEYEVSQAHELNSWVEQELRRRGVQDLATTMAVAESLWIIEGETPLSPSHHPRVTRPKVEETRNHEATLLRKDQAKALVARMEKRKALNAMIEENEKKSDAQVGLLQLLNTLEANPMPKTPQSKELMYVEALVNKKGTKALVDTGATHNFVSKDEIRRLELQASKERGWLKAVNSTTKPSHGVAREVTMHIGSWEGRVDFTVAPMDDFKMVLGMDFL
ncbi:hypothetical protein CK203_062025 [Vitis vinifera]|uniref:Retrotransposon gag domain-containing protein n=1 Tax=Vitis vinifera TaxID=29760 RepID=A0A438GEQ2_VITVI|nr:hypothetical protein CK203_062025 [Vitis vinifera]